MVTDLNTSLLSVKQFLAIVPVGRTSLYQQINEGSIKTVKFGARTLIPGSEVLRLIASASAPIVEGESSIA